ncbi:MAG: UDP-N-acetylglucosamine 2-epimerase, partial [Clostridia bacterium]|nr:UDP-N-acetylglucosamine 2-epimerase [Clostridia bacterium]
MKKICTVVGARPQFIKLAVVSRELRKKFNEVIIHTGQHYDYNMSDVFFEEMGIPHPDYNLGISGGTHGVMTGQMLASIEDVLIKEKPDMLLVFGDTNSTMAAALAAVKLHIPVCHVEAGNRLGTYENPEEVNRIVTDHVSSLHLVCTPSGVDFLKKEGFDSSVHLVGDPMYDAFCYYSETLSGKELDDVTDFDGNKVVLPQNLYYMTCHR